MTNKPPPEEKKQTTGELKAVWLKLSNTLERVIESREGVREQTRIVKEKIREYRAMLERLKGTEVEGSWLQGLEKLTDEAWGKYQASAEGEAENGK